MTFYTSKRILEVEGQQWGAVSSVEGFCGNVMMKEKLGLETNIMGSKMKEFAVERGIEEEFMELFNPKGSAKAELLRSICCGTEISGLDQLEEKVFAYGSLLKQKDSLEREVFAHMYTILRQMKKSAEESNIE